MKNIKQIDIAKALELTRKGEKVYVITFNSKTPIIKSFNNLSVGDVLSEDNGYMFVIFEEA